MRSISYASAPKFHTRIPQSEQTEEAQRLCDVDIRIVRRRRRRRGRVSVGTVQKWVGAPSRRGFTCDVC
jgi:hypothetical protein